MTTERKVTFFAFKAVLLAIAAEKPDHRYGDGIGACYYHPENNKGRCIIGETLSRLGWSDDELESLDGSVAVIAHQIGSFTTDEVEWLSQVQGWQDCGKTWGEAVTFDKEV